MQEHMSPIHFMAGSRYGFKEVCRNRQRKLWECSKVRDFSAKAAAGIFPAAVVLVVYQISYDYFDCSAANVIHPLHPFKLFIRLELLCHPIPFCH